MTQVDQTSYISALIASIGALVRAKVKLELGLLSQLQSFMNDTSKIYCNISVFLR